MKKIILGIFIIVLMTIGCGDNKGAEETANGDYLDITSVSPMEVAEGEVVSFTVNVDMRLVSRTSGSIFIGFNTDPEHPEKYIVKRVADIAEANEGSLSFNLADVGFSTHPIFYDQSKSYNIYVNLSPYIQSSSETWTPLASDTWPITVVKGTSQTDDQPTGFYAECDFLECNGRYNYE